MLDPWLEDKLNERRTKQLLRKLTTRHNLIDFTSNDYLGLAGSTELFKTIEHEAKQVVPISNGSAGSRLLSGNSEYAEQLEAKLAGIFHSESALIFNSGYTANVGLLSSIATKDSTIIYDELAHACIKDGARLSQAKRYSFKHNDISDLESKIRKSSGKIFLVVESIYSMDGDMCPLSDVVALAEKYDAEVIIDEAHSTGVIGKDGCGLAVSLGLHEKIVARIYTFGKAMGVHGACVAGSRLLQQYLINFSRPFIYTTALPAHSLVAIECGFNYLARNSTLQQSLRHKINVYLANVGNLSNRTNSTSAIQTILVEGNENAIQVAAHLQQRGYDVRPILSPTVPVGKERLRICLHTYNSDEEIKGLTEELKAISIQHSPL